MTELNAGTELGPYRVVRLLGRGGMGEVYLAKHIHTGWMRALKILPEELSAEEEYIVRFKREAAVVGTLDHPNIVDVKELSASEGRFYLVMDYVEGPGGAPLTLQEYVEKAGGQLAEKEFERLLIQICEGVQYAHEKGIIHRDLKPSNVLLNEKNDALLADFGLARIVGSEFMQSRIDQTLSKSQSFGGEETLAGPRSSEPTEDSLGAEVTGGGMGSSSRSALGTWDYMSPEVKNHEEATTQSDIYAIGVITYFCLTGQHQVGFETPSELVEGLSTKWDDIFRKAAAFQPERRYKDCNEIIQDLKREAPVSPKMEPVRESEEERLERKRRERLVQQQQERIRLESQLKDAIQRGAHRNIVRLGLTLKQKGWLVGEFLKAARKSHGTLLERRRWKEQGDEAFKHKDFERAHALWKQGLESEPDKREWVRRVERVKKILDLTTATRNAIEAKNHKKVLALTEKLVTLKALPHEFDEAIARSEIQATHAKRIYACAIAVSLAVAALFVYDWYWFKYKDEGIDSKSQEVDSETGPKGPSAEPALSADVPAPTQTPLAADTPTIVPPTPIRSPTPLPTATKTAIPMEIVLEILKDRIRNTNEMDFRLVAPGTFVMGSREGEPDEAPAHEVTIADPFYIGVYEVTQKQYQAIMGTNPSLHKNPGHPVENVRWYDAKTFCSRLTLREHITYRLPTEAEWEYVCRAGMQEKYPWGDKYNDYKDYAWTYENARHKTEKVGTKRPTSALGIFDLIGNVLEWCEDAYDPQFYQSEDALLDNPVRKDDNPSVKRVLRGGELDRHAWDCYCANRNSEAPTFSSGFVGFRVVREVALNEISIE